MKVCVDEESELIGRSFELWCELPSPCLPIKASPSAWNFQLGWWLMKAKLLSFEWRRSFAKTSTSTQAVRELDSVIITTSDNFQPTKRCKWKLINRSLMTLQQTPKFFFFSLTTETRYIRNDDDAHTPSSFSDDEEKFVKHKPNLPSGRNFRLRRQREIDQFRACTAQNFSAGFFKVFSSVRWTPLIHLILFPQQFIARHKKKEKKFSSSF